MKSARQQVLVLALTMVAQWPAAAANAPVCAGCHREIWEKYRQTGMGRSFDRPSAANTPAEGSTYYHQPSDSWFSVTRRGGEYFQRRHQVDSRGAQINVLEKRIDYVMGSGNHARTYLHRTSANTLIELPLGWYAEKGGYWAMNPGYDRPDHEGFRRTVTYDCMFCHNAYPRIPAGNDKPLAPAVYEGPLPEGIDCQRCHGAGTRHVQLAGTAGAKRQDIRASILNPARLTPERQMEVCMVCHLQTTSFPLPNAIQRYDRGPFSWSPGERLDAFILNFDHAPGTGRENKFEIVNAAYRLRRSACFLKSGAKMTCTTCHNPHDAPRGEAADRHYSAVCRSCHESDHVRAAANDCAGCHMPKRRTEDVVHVVVTDHLIQRQKPASSLLADRPERHETGANAYRGPVALYYPETLPQTPENELYLAVAQVKQGSNLKAGIRRLAAAVQKYSPVRPEFYLELADALVKDRQLSAAIAWYRRALQRDPKSPAVLQRLGSTLRRAGQPEEAVNVLTRATTLVPAQAPAWHELSLTYQTLNRPGEAIAAVQTALTHDPEFAEAHNNLGLLLLQTQSPGSPETSFREAIRLRPDYADAHGNLANVLAAQSHTAEAREHFEVSLRLRPGDAPTRYNYALLLGRIGQYDAAQRELESALRTDPDFADAHDLLARLLTAKGQPQSAIPHYRELVRLRPNSATAHLNLGAALASAGDRALAISHLRKAAEDPNVRAQAEQILRQLGQR